MFLGEEDTGLGEINELRFVLAQRLACFMPLWCVGTALEVRKVLPPDFGNPIVRRGKTTSLSDGVIHLWGDGMTLNVFLRLERLSKPPDKGTMLLKPVLVKGFMIRYL